MLQQLPCAKCGMNMHWLWNLPAFGRVRSTGPEELSGGEGELPEVDEFASMDVITQFQ